MRILVCGSREWTDDELIRGVLSDYPANTVVIHGDNGNTAATVGADRIAARIARELFLMPPIAFPAQWDQQPQGRSKAAGPKRNTQMLKEGQPHLVIAFHDDLPNSKGTLDMVNKARKAKVSLRIVTHHGESLEPAHIDTDPGTPLTLPVLPQDA